MADAAALLAGHLDVDLAVAPRIDDRRLAAGADQIGEVGEALRLDFLDEHRFPPGGWTGSQSCRGGNEAAASGFRPPPRRLAAAPLSPRALPPGSCRRRPPMIRLHRPRTPHAPPRAPHRP